MQWFWKLLEKAGLCKAFVDPYGRVIVLRYHLFGIEPDEMDVDEGRAKPRWLPNIWLHRIPSLEHGPDGGNYHTHPWATMSIVLSGGYEEFTLGKKTKWRLPGHVVFRGADSAHYLGKTKAGTVSLFFHWFRKHGWTFRLADCKNVCDWCNENNAGSCRKDGVEMAYNDYNTQLGEKWTAKWMVYNDECHAWIKKRKRAVERAGLVPPTAEELERYIQTTSRAAIEIGAGEHV